MLEVDTSCANGVGEALDATMVGARTSVEYHCADTGSLEFVAELRVVHLSTRNGGENLLAVRVFPTVSSMHWA